MRSATTDQPSWAFAAPGYCCDHWQLGRATMTVLGFRPVPGGETEQGNDYIRKVDAMLWRTLFSSTCQ
jgi:hypothetical protein